MYYTTVAGWMLIYFVGMATGRFEGLDVAGTVLAVFENIIAMFMDLHQTTRPRASLLALLVLLVLCMPCALGYNVWSSVQPLGKGSTILDFEDFLVSNILLPVGALVFALFCTWNFGWGWDRFVAEANTGRGMKIRPWMKPLMKFVLPILIGIILVMGLR